MVNMGLLLVTSSIHEELLEWAGMVNCKPINTPVDTKAKLSSSAGAKFHDPIFYCSLDGALQYLMMMHTNITYIVQHVCLHMHNPHDCHMVLIKHILRYVRGTTDLGIHIHGSPSTDIVAYSDTDCALCPGTRRSTLSYFMYIGGILVSLSSKRQPTVSWSSVQAE
ncbi:uncharacterized mitochondrial protein AtMg00810-like [Phragmites australis]|uniref:uncharacterized mitochondrial protein AtMg00810-like n=1 Tax=Phragmites australis TaxID=29695 RepID=UPI002D77623A|nr:uncharacterized mitochondrial protein AtMg00810-like [Phragmites australis]